MVAGEAGLEPTYSESKSDILPLDEGTIWSVVGLQSPEAPTQVIPLWRLQRDSNPYHTA